MHVLNRFFVVFSCLYLMGCHHQIAFQDIDYTIDAPKHDGLLVVIIEPSTLNQVVPIRSWMTGIAHSWDAKPGEMLKQVADIEFPQLFELYEMKSILKESQEGESGITLKLTVPHYTFADFHATVSVRGVARKSGEILLFDKTYTKTGIRQGAKMFWGGAFGMKSSIRQSSFDAYKQIMVALRADLLKTLHP